MKIFSSSDIQEIDQYTIQNEPIESIDLMERASNVFMEWFVHEFPSTNVRIAVFCGPGNNGGDGLAIARLLQDRAYSLLVYICHIGTTKSNDFEINYNRLPLKKGIAVASINHDDKLPDLSEIEICIDGIFGSGLNRPVYGYWGKLINHINQADAIKISIDIPSGLFSDQSTEGTVIEADEVLSFEFPKLAFMFPENGEYVKNWRHLSIGLHPEIINSKIVDHYYLDLNRIRKILRSRNKFDHKGNFGHALFAGGSYGKIGAVVLAAKACLRSGSGLLTCFIPKCGYEILQSTVPESMIVSSSQHDYLNSFEEDLDFDAIGLGCGLGTAPECYEFLNTLLNKVNQPLVIDADALNLISAQRHLLEMVPVNSILTPHPKEFARLFGESQNNFEQNDLQRKMSIDHKVYILLKGAHSCLSTPEGKCYFNSTGNPGMATAGSGDVLAGILTGLMAQGYSSLDTALLGMYLHGMAGDEAAEDLNENSIVASDIVSYLPRAFSNLNEF